MKRYIAYFQTNVSAVSTKEEAHKWAAKMLAEKPTLAEVRICEIVEVAERTTPTIATRPFFTQLDPSVAEEAQAKAA